MGAHDAPRPCYHGEFLRAECIILLRVGQQIFYKLVRERQLIKWKNGDSTPNILKPGSWWVSENETITGLITYLGQLFIFKETKTYVLTDDIQVASLRTIFEDVGCVNVRGGHGYIVADDKLFFVSKNWNLYMFDGNQK